MTCPRCTATLLTIDGDGYCLACAWRQSEEADRQNAPALLAADISRDRDRGRQVTQRSRRSYGGRPPRRISAVAFR